MGRIRHPRCSFFLVALASPKLRISLAAILWAVSLGATGCDKFGGDDGPTAPSGPPAIGSTIRYTPVGASDVTGVGSSVLCFPFLVDCPNGTGYAFVAARQLRTQNYTVIVTNHGIPSAVISRGFQDLGRQYGKDDIAGNFIEQQMPFVPADSTLVTIFAGVNDVNVITAALAGGGGSGDRNAFIDQQVRNFGNDYTTLLTGIRTVARSARVIVLNLPNIAGMPFRSRSPLPERQAAQRASVRMTTTVINSLPNVTVVDLMCDARMYQPSIYSSDGLHPNDSGYAIIADEIVRAVTLSSYPVPKSSCAQMTLVP